MFGLYDSQPDQEIEFVEKLPKTRSGKIMRRLLKARERGESLRDVPTLEPGSIADEADE